MSKKRLKKRAKNRMRTMRKRAVEVFTFSPNFGLSEMRMKELIKIHNKHMKTVFSVLPPPIMNIDFASTSRFPKEEENE